MDTKKNRIILAILAFGLYFITGTVCALRGAELNILADLYNVGIDTIVLIGTAFAIGRVGTVYFTGKAVQKYNPLLIMFIGVVLIGMYLVGTILIPIVKVSYVLAFLGGVGMGTQDAICPLFLSYSFTKRYASSLSAGQALYGLGGFAMSFLVGLMFTLNVDPTVSNYIIAITALALLVLIPFAKYDHKLVQNSDDSESVKPLFAKNETLAFILLGFEGIIYCIAVNSLCTYTSSFGLFKGFDNDTSAYLLTAYNVGCVIGSIAFVFMLKKMKEITVLIINSIISVVGVGLLFLSENLTIYFIAFIIAGLFSGVLYSIILAIATRIGYKKIAVASAFVGTAGGIGDILAPIITAYLISKFTLVTVFKYILILFVLQALVAIVLKNITKED